MQKQTQERRRKNWLTHATMKTNRMKGKNMVKKSLFVEKKNAKEVYDYYEYEVTATTIILLYTSSKHIPHYEFISSSSTK